MEPGLIEIRPLRITEIVTAALRSLVRNPAATVGIALNFAILLGLASLASLLVVPPNEQFLTQINELSTSGQIDTQEIQLLLDDLVPTFVLLLTLTLMLFLFQILVTGVLTPVVGFLVTGTKLSANESWARVKPIFSKLILLAVLIMVIQITALITPTFIVILISSILPESVSSFLISVSLIVGLILLIVAWTSLLLAPSVLVIENVSIKNSLMRSRLLVKKNFARVFFGALWASLIAQALAFIVQIPFELLKSNDPANVSTFSIFLDTIQTIFGYSLLLPFFASFIVLVYTDQRIRHENLSQNLKSALGQ